MNSFLTPANGYRNSFANPNLDFVTELDFEAIAHHENFMRIWEQLKGKPRKAAGLDDFRCEDYTKSELAKVVRTLQTLIRNGTYKPGPSRRVSWPKPGGNGTRDIDIRNVPDRVVSLAVAKPISKALESILLPTCFAYRPNKSSLDLLAQLRHRIESTGMTVVAQDDIRNAFGSLDIGRVRSDFASELLPPEIHAQLLRLMSAIWRGNMRRQIGIEQGDPLSPFTLNLRLHYCRDLPFHLTTDPDNQTWNARFSDNLVYQAGSVSEGLRALERDRRILAGTEFCLKGENNYPVDLRRQGSSIEVLGFKIRMSNARVLFDLGKRAINNLSHALANASTKPDPIRMCKHVLTGWIMEYGAAFDSYGPERYLTTVKEICLRHRLYEYSSEAWILGKMLKAIHVWESICERALDDVNNTDDMVT